jgi:hypothetical protein
MQLERTFLALLHIAILRQTVSDVSKECGKACLSCRAFGIEEPYSRDANQDDHCSTHSTNWGRACGSRTFFALACSSIRSRKQPNVPLRVERTGLATGLSGEVLEKVPDAVTADATVLPLVWLEETCRVEGKGVKCTSNRKQKYWRMHAPGKQAAQLLLASPARAEKKPAWHGRHRRPSWVYCPAHIFNANGMSIKCAQL